MIILKKYTKITAILPIAAAIIAPETSLSTTPVTTSKPSDAELQRLLKQASDARLDAEDALRRAKATEAELTRLLSDRNDAPALAASVAPSPPPPSPQSPARMDCIVGYAGCEGVAAGYDLMAYPYKDGEDRSQWAETRLTNFIETEAQKKAEAQNKKEKKREISFASIDQPFTSRISLAKGDEAMDAQYSFPLSRRRISQGNGFRPITSSLGLGFSAAFDPDNKKVGLIARNGSYSDDQLAVTLTFGRQRYPVIPSHDAENSAENRAKNFANALIRRCEEAMAAKADHFGTTSTKPLGCSDTDLLAWSFDPDATDRYKANVAAYNQAFWEPSAKALPELGWGFTATMGMQNFKYILPDSFAPGIVIDPQTPNLLSTLLAKSDDGSKPDLGQREARRFSPSLGAYAFRHFEGKFLLFDGLLIRPSATVARRWDIDDAFKGQEYCAIKLATIGECKTFNIMAPKANWSFEPALNIRTRFDLGWGKDNLSRYFGTIGLSPTITYNSHKDSYRLAAPVYLAADKDGNLTGGIQFARDWGNANPDKNESVWSIFLSTAFSMNGAK